VLMIARNLAQKPASSKARLFLERKETDE
jgi:hypothetical protein